MERACRCYWGSIESTFVQDIQTGLCYHGLILEDGTWVYACSLRHRRAGGTDDEHLIAKGNQVKRTWWEYSLGYLWALPNTLIGLLLALTYIPKRLTWRNGCLEVVGCRWMIGNPDAQTWGWLVCYRNAEVWEDMPLRAHERTHVVQGMRGGVFFLLAYASCFLYYYISPPKTHYKPRWYKAYMAIPYEVTAYKVQAAYKPSSGVWA